MALELARPTANSCLTLHAVRTASHPYLGRGWVCVHGGHPLPHPRRRIPQRQHVPRVVLVAEVAAGGAGGPGASRCFNRSATAAAAADAVGMGRARWSGSLSAGGAAVVVVCVRGRQEAPPAAGQQRLARRPLRPRLPLREMGNPYQLHHVSLVQRLQWVLQHELRTEALNHSSAGVWQVQKAIGGVRHS